LVIDEQMQLRRKQARIQNFQLTRDLIVARSEYFHRAVVLRTEATVFSSADQQAQHAHGFRGPILNMHHNVGWLTHPAILHLDIRVGM
jgi:hypothetical protein